MDFLKDLESAEHNFCQWPIKKVGLYAIMTVQRFWNERCQSSCWCISMWWWQRKELHKIKIAVGEREIGQHSDWALCKLQFAPDETNKGEIFQMCESANMAIYAIDMMKFEANDNLVTHSQEVLNFSVRMMYLEIWGLQNFELSKFHILPLLFWGSCGCDQLYNNKCIIQCRN